MTDSTTETPAAPQLKKLPVDLDRRKFIGGSDAAAIMGVGAYEKTPYSVWLAKTDPVPPDQAEDNARRKFLERRKRWEPVIVQMLREEFDAEIVAVNERYQDAQHDFLSCEIDFEWLDEDGTVQNGEIKTVSPFAFGERFGWGEAGTGDVPVHYEAQAMHGLGITGRRVCILAAMIGLDNMIFYRIERDDETIAGMRQQCVDFWQKHVVKNDPPDPQTLRDTYLRWGRKDNGLELPADDPLASKVLALRGLRAQVEALELQGESLEFDIKMAMKENQFISVNGKKLCTWKLRKTTTLDQSGLKAEHPKIHRAFVRQGMARVFQTLKGN